MFSNSVGNFNTFVNTFEVLQNQNLAVYKFILFISF